MSSSYVVDCAAVWKQPPIAQAAIFLCYYPSYGVIMNYQRCECLSRTVKLLLTHWQLIYQHQQQFYHISAPPNYSLWEQPAPLCNHKVIVKYTVSFKLIVITQVTTYLCLTPSIVPNPAASYPYSAKVERMTAMEPAVIQRYIYFILLTFVRL